jgi:hypothetical protein
MQPTNPIKINEQETYASNKLGSSNLQKETLCNINLTNQS